MAIRDEVSLPDIPVLSLSEEECKAFKDSFVKPFHLNRGPLFDFAVVKTPENVKLFTDFHHLVFDGFSMSVFLKELSKTLKKGGEIGTEGASYFTYVRNQKEMLSSDAGASYEKYFEELLSDFESTTELPADLRNESADGNKRFLYKDILSP